MTQIKIEQFLSELAESLISCGVNTVFGIPGTGYSLDFLTRFVGGGGIHHLTKHEATSVIMAGTVGNRHDIPGLAICANGIARINLLAGVLHCKFEKLPVIVVWDEEPKDSPYFQKLQRLPNHDHNLFFNHIIDGLEGHADALARELVERAMCPEQGPVGVSLRSAGSANDEPVLIKYRTQNISYVKSRLTQSKFPLFIFGHRCLNTPDSYSIRQLFKNLNVAKLTSLSAKGLFPEDDPYCFLTYTGVGGKQTYESKIIDHADLVVAVNLKHDVIKVSPIKKETIFLDCHSLEGSEGFYPDAFCYLTYPELVNITQHISSKWCKATCVEVKEEVKKCVLTEQNQCGLLIDQLSPLLYGKSTVVVDDGIYQKLSEYFLLAENPGDYVSTSVGRNMGSALPAAIAISKVSKEESVVCFTGDGGLPMYLSELSLLKGESSKLLVLNFADYSLGSIRTRSIEHVDVVAFAGDSYLNLMEQFDFVAKSSSSIEVIVELVKSWAQSPYPLYIEFIIDPVTYPSLFHLIRN
jgi:thiamine pyrophosphate-dependent acetolactate synthase large subunit-like protein